MPVSDNPARTDLHASPRERLVRAAAELFYAEGVHPTGVDAIVAAARVSKPTLYHQFGSKDALLTAVLERRHENRQQSFAAYLEAAARTPRARLKAVFDWLEGWLGEGDFHGCALVNAAVEVAGGPAALAAREITARNKRWMREHLATLAREGGYHRPELLARGLLLIIEGAVVMAFVEHDPRAAADARAAGMALMAAHDEPATVRNQSRGKGRDQRRSKT